ncbi:MAG: hypothetical protein LAO77_24085 [Acidobacteriia bacterium]|nr:hypothetical protein [Terriglobia bacterium]
MKIVEPAQKGLADILLGSLGLSGVIALGAILLGVVLAVVMVWFRSRSAGSEHYGPLDR